MNIFVLDRDPKTAARYHCDKHICKMILEAGQMLSTAHWVSWMEELGITRSDFKLVRDLKSYLSQNVPSDKKPPWSLTHINHPCSIWTRETISNYCWHARLMRSLLDEYSKRYDNKIHKSESVWKWLDKNIPPNIKNEPLTDHPICMPEEYKISKSPVECYREYYLKDKVRFAKWKNGNIPNWWKIGENQ